MNQLQMQELEELQVTHDEQQERPQFIITDLNGLNWAFRKMSAITAKMNEVKSLAKAERERIDTWEQKECAGYESDLEYFTQQISQYHASVLKKDPKAKSIKTPYGVAKSTTTKPTPEKTDEKALVEYAKANDVPVVEEVVTEKLKWAELKKMLSVVEMNGEQVVIDENGQVVPGVVAKPATTTFKVEVHE